MKRFYGKMTQQQIGSELGISPMHASRLLGDALGYLKERITGVPESCTASSAEPRNRDLPTGLTDES